MVKRQNNKAKEKITKKINNMHCYNYLEITNNNMDEASFSKFTNRFLEADTIKKAFPSKATQIIQKTEIDIINKNKFVVRLLSKHIPIIDFAKALSKLNTINVGLYAENDSLGIWTQLGTIDYKKDPKYIPNMVKVSLLVEFLESNNNRILFDSFSDAKITEARKIVYKDEPITDEVIDAILSEETINGKTLVQIFDKELENFYLETQKEHEEETVNLKLSKIKEQILNEQNSKSSPIINFVVVIALVFMIIFVIAIISGVI